jgi:hypothetical protein
MAAISADTEAPAGAPSREKADRAPMLNEPTMYPTAEEPPIVPVVMTSSTFVPVV